MPTYQYACTACDHRLEAVQSFADDPLTQCPECDGRLRKLFGSVGIVFKGPGFYRTDSRAGANGSGNGKKTDSGGAATDTKSGGKELASSATSSASTAAGTSTTSGTSSPASSSSSSSSSSSAASSS